MGKHNWTPETLPHCAAIFMEQISYIRQTCGEKKTKKKLIYALIKQYERIECSLNK